MPESMPYLDKYHISLNATGYIISQKDGIRYYQKKRAPTFVNKFGGGDSAYRDATFWQYFVQTNWRNGAKQLKWDDAGKYWKSENVNTTILEELTLSKAWQSAGQMISGGKIHAMEAWRSSTSWFNNNYGYRQQITITAPSDKIVPAGYPIIVTIDTAALQTASKVRSDRKDWRVVYFNGSSSVELSIDYVTTTKTVFALQNQIAAGGSDSNYFVYYGYSSESTTKQASTEAEYNAVYGLYGTTPDANSIAVWHFREGTGSSVADDSASTNTGTATSLSWATTGRYARAGDFTGSSSLAVGTGIDLGSMTIEGFFKPTALASDQQLYNRRSASGTGVEFLIKSGGLLRFACYTASGEIVLTSATALSAGTEYHLAATHDGSTMKIWINGVQNASVAAGPPISQTGTAIVGAQADGSLGQKFTGLISHMRISNTDRSSYPYVLSSEPTTLYGSETSTQPPQSSFDLYGGGSDGKVYKWDGTTTWTEQFDTRRLVFYETGTDANRVVGDTGGTETAQSQGFQLATATTVKGLEVYIKKGSGTPGDITVRIETNSTDKPSGSLANAAATATIPAFSTTSYGWVSVEFATAFSLSATTTYHIVLKTAAASNDTYYHWAADASSPSFSSGANSHSEDGGSTWAADTTTDQYFRLKGNTTEVNCMLVTNIGGTQKLYIGTGSQSGETNGDARLYSFDGTNWALVKTFATSTESMILSMNEYTANSKIYLGLGPQAKIYETSDFSTFTISKDINIPQNPGYPWAIKEYNRVLHVGGGSPEFLPAQFYNGFMSVYDTTAWNILYPFDFTVIKSLEFYDAYLFMGTYRGDLYVYDTATLNPLFNFKDQYDYAVEIKSMKYFDDKLYIGLYPQVSSNETNVGIWLFDRRGLSQAHTISGVTGYRCFAVVNGALMVGTGDDGYVYKLNQNVYSTTGFAQSSYFDANLPSIDKLYNNVTIRHDALLEGQSIVVYYKFKESDSFTLLGTSNTVGDIEKVLEFASGTTSKKISLKYILNTTDTTSSPKLTEVIMQYSLYPDRKWQWTIRIKAKKDQRLLDNSIDGRSATTIRSTLEDLLSTQQLYTFIDIDGTSYDVLVNEIDSTSWVVNQRDVNEDEVLLNLLEA